MDSLIKPFLFGELIFVFTSVAMVLTAQYLHIKLLNRREELKDAARV